MFAQRLGRSDSGLAKKIVREKEQKGISYRLRCVREHANVEAIKTPLYCVDLARGILDRVVFLGVRRVGMFS